MYKIADPVYTRTHIVLDFLFPKPHYLPALRRKLQIDLSIPLYVSFYFGYPKPSDGFYAELVVFPIESMPEFSIDKNCEGDTS
jgi:hypothetical protein